MKSKKVLIEEFAGICKVCFGPVIRGSEIQVRKKGQYYHKSCTQAYPNSYYLVLETILGRYEHGEDIDILLKELVNIFGINKIKNKNFSEDFKEVIWLYELLTEKNINNY